MVTNPILIAVYNFTSFAHRGCILKVLRLRQGFPVVLMFIQLNETSVGTSTALTEEKVRNEIQRLSPSLCIHVCLEIQAKDLVHYYL